ncbi:MAG: hypothetical protein E6K22_09300 [Gammaproteobacteria bacterium]|nr:MAG: hypothetical protein E6K22_09300 [Gammaproteobacteria bacterium]
MRPLPRLLLLTVLVVAVPADAKTTVIDDSGTLPYDAPLVLHWQQLSPRRPVNNRMTGTLTVRVKQRFLVHTGPAASGTRELR